MLKSRVEELNEDIEIHLKSKFTKGSDKTLPDLFFILGPYLGYSYSTQKPLQPLACVSTSDCDLRNSLDGCGVGL